MYDTKTNYNIYTIHTEYYHYNYIYINYQIHNLIINYINLQTVQQTVETRKMNEYVNDDCVTVELRSRRY